MTAPPRHPGLDPGSRVFCDAGQGSVTPGQGRGDGWRRLALTATVLLAPLALAACGKAAGLAPAPGQRLPVAPIGARATPTPAELLTPTTQQRPQRSDELLLSSQERRSDDFDLPPE